MPVTLGAAEPGELSTLVELAALADVRLRLVDLAGLARVARSDGQIVGLAVGRIVADEVELDLVAVAPAARRLGIGRALVRDFLAAAVEGGAGRCFLEVRAGNTAARRLYEAEGFSESGRRRRYYRDGEDACLYARALGAGRLPPGNAID